MDELRPLLGAEAGERPCEALPPLTAEGLHVPAAGIRERDPSASRVGGVGLTGGEPGVDRLLHEAGGPGLVDPDGVGEFAHGEGVVGRRECLERAHARGRAAQGRMVVPRPARSVSPAVQVVGTAAMRTARTAVVAGPAPTHAGERGEQDVEVGIGFGHASNLHVT